MKNNLSHNGTSSNASRRNRVLFVSYHHSNGDFVEVLANELKTIGLQAWRFQKKLVGGQDWKDAIDKAIRKSKILIVVITPEANTSEYVTFEWSFAMGCRIPVIPILLKDTQGIHPRLDLLHHFDFRNFDARPWTELLRYLSRYN